MEVAVAPAYVSRGGVKLANALDALGVAVSGRSCLDVGASTGGFTDCLLQRGAERVIALDVAYGELDYRLREDSRVTVIERTNARAISELPYPPSLIVIDVSFISLTKVLPAVVALASERFDCLAMVKPQFEVGRDRVGKGGVVRDPELRREAVASVAACGTRSAARCSASRRAGCPDRRATWRPSRGSARAGARGARGRGRGARGGGGVTRVVTVMTHRRMRETSAAVRELIASARRAGVTLRFSADEASKHALTAGEGIEIARLEGADLCIVLGGDGTILTALREYAGTGTPVFAVNYGEVGFLATVDPEGLGSEFDRAFAGDFETLRLPTITVGRPDGQWTAINDISVHRKPGLRVADLAYGLAGEEIGRVRCDGLVVSTPAGSTGYNLANAGPILAWGVRGYVVSFIAPHSLTARALVVGPEDLLTINNASREEPVEVHVDGRPACELRAGEDIHVEFGREYGVLAQLPGASFYHRLRERFGRLAR